MTVRISATDWCDGGIGAEDAVEIARAFAEHGAAGIDVSTGQVVSEERPAFGRSYQTPYADRIRNEIGRKYGVAVIAVGAISSYDDVNSIILAGRADLCALGRTHLYDPQWTLHAGGGAGVRGGPLASAVRRGQPPAAGRPYGRPSTAPGPDPPGRPGDRPRPMEAGRGHLVLRQAVAIKRRADLTEPLGAQLAPVGELVASIPAPRCDHRQHEDPALAQQVLIDTRIVLTDFLGRMGEVEFDRPTATRLEVDEQQPVLRGEQVARVRLAVQELLRAAALADHSSQASQRVAEELPVRVGERRSVVAAGHELLRLLDAIREVRRRDVERTHAGMQPLERIGVVGR